MAGEAVRREWLRRVEAEYRSAALTHHFTHWLIQIGASPDLIEGGLRIVADELTHSALSEVVYRESGGTDFPHLDRATLGLHRTAGAPVEVDVLLVAVDMFCIGETVAVRLFQTMREGCDVECARRALDRIVKDEVFHRDFGWTVLEWLLATPAAPTYRALLDQHLPKMLKHVRERYGGGPHASDTASDANTSTDDRRWGLIPRSLYVEAVEETFKRDYTPRFNDFGISSNG